MRRENTTLAAGVQAMTRRMKRYREKPPVDSLGAHLALEVVRKQRSKRSSSAMSNSGVSSKRC